MENESSTPTMESAGELLNRGKTQEALDAFHDVHLEQVRRGESPTPEVLQMIGVCYRMLRDYRHADMAFTEALDHATTDEQHGKIFRDWAMVPLEQDERERALEMLESSERYLRSNPREQAATLGFEGRFLAKTKDYSGARWAYAEADERLRRFPDTQVYQLNNLVWWLKIESSPITRAKLARRAWQLARQTKNRKRQAQIALLLAFWPLGR